VTLPWHTLERVELSDGALELRQRGERDFLILRDGRVLMTSVQQRSELALGTLACRAIGARAHPRVLVAGLGMGYTLRATLDSLPPRADVVVAELHEAVARWVRGPLAALTGHVLDDPRVRLVLGDVAEVIAEAAYADRFDAIVLDLYEGPRPSAGDPADDHLFGGAALSRTRAALRPGGLLAIWSEAIVTRFEKRLAGSGFAVEPVHPARGARRYVVYLARPRVK
jgi:spermidine synthase